MRTSWRCGRWVAVVFASGLLGMRGAPLSAQGSANPVGSLGGTAKTETGAPAVGVQVSVDGLLTRAITRDDGSFLLAGIPAGPVRVTARRLGYLPARSLLDIPAGGTLHLEITMRPAPIAMAPVTVTARAEVSDARLAGFNARAASRGSGYIFTRDKIEQTANRSAMDLVRNVPGVRIVTNGRGASQARTIRFRSNRCPPVVFIDGFAAAAGEFDLESIDLNMVEGVEIYLSSTTLPPEFFASALGLEQCGVIAIWSRPTQARPAQARRSGAEEAAAARLAAFSADSVEDAAYPIGGDPQIVYPDSLWRAATAGEVTVKFVVDARGRLDWGTLEVVKESHELFTKSVLEALALVRWEAARRGGRPVAQIVVLPVVFSR